MPSGRFKYSIYNVRAICVDPFGFIVEHMIEVTGEIWKVWQILAFLVIIE